MDGGGGGGGGGGGERRDDDGGAENKPETPTTRNGAVRRVRFLEAMTAAILSGHRRIPPYGMAGGLPAQVGRNRVERIDGSIEELGGADQAEMNPGDVFVIETPGGGGFGKA